MGVFIGRNRKARVAYGFDDIAIAPANKTVEPALISTDWELGEYKFGIPFLSAAMDSVTDVNMCIKLGRMGGLGVLNLEGLNTRYDNPAEIYHKIAETSANEGTQLLQRLYAEPVKEELIYRRIKEIKEGGVISAASVTPPNAEKFYNIAIEAGLDIIVIQSTFITLTHEAKTYKALNIEKFCKESKIPVILGNTGTYEATLELLRAGADGILVGIGPGAACTTRIVTGIGMPQVTATADAAAARDQYLKESGKRCAIITDGGMINTGDICKAFVSGADAVMLGSIFSRAQDAPGCGFHWGMATPNQDLPRGTRIKVKTHGTLERIVFGPSDVTYGTLNLLGALKTSMASVGAKTLREFQQCEIIISSSILNEGLKLQRGQNGSFF